jgi:hypothetical protein
LCFDGVKCREGVTSVATKISEVVAVENVLKTEQIHNRDRDVYRHYDIHFTLTPYV